MGEANSKSGAPDQPEVGERLTALEAVVAANQQKIADLQERAEQSNHRAAQGEWRSSEDRERIGVLEERAEVDAVLIAELRAEGVLQREHAANLEVALRTSRTIGAAIGILMARQNVSEADAFALLRQASMRSNRKLRDLADEVVFTGGLTT